MIRGGKEFVAGARERETDLRTFEEMKSSGLGDDLGVRSEQREEPRKLPDWCRPLSRGRSGGRERP